MSKALLSSVLTATGLALAATMSLADAAKSAVFTEGLTFSVADGSHFHSNTGNDFLTPPGKAEVGSYPIGVLIPPPGVELPFSANNEEIWGLSEFDLSGLENEASAFVTFNVYNDGGLFPFFNDYPFAGEIDIVAYAGNNAEDVTDYEAAVLGTVGSFSTSGLAEGDTLSFDVTSIFNQAIDDSLVSLGFRLQRSGGIIDGGAWTFDAFQLTSPDATTPVPEPKSLLGLIGVSLALLGRKSIVSLIRKT